MMTYFNLNEETLKNNVAQNIRERKGSFFTPRIWVELSQKYIADVFGEDWQENYYVWDCAAGTGNLLAGLTNKYRIYASTIDQADVKIMHERIKSGANLLEDHVFQFDFLNDSFDELPASLRSIIKNEPEKLIVYINPPYAETMSYGKKHKAGLNKSMVNDAYKDKMGAGANRELFVQFLVRIYYEIPSSKIANFSKLKFIQSPYFKIFRQNFQTELKISFLVPANSFDNVVGHFPIGFYIWDTKKKTSFVPTEVDVFDSYGTFKCKKNILIYDKYKSINEWIRSTRNRRGEKKIGFISCLGNDFQTKNLVFVMNEKNQMAAPRGSWITDKNLLEVAIYFTIRKVIPATWLNDRDQFLYPNDGWKKNKHFQSDCLVYTLFHNSNNIKSKYGINHWTPFTAEEVNARTRFESSFMTDFITGKLKTKKTETNALLRFQEPEAEYNLVPRGSKGLSFSDRALEVLKAGRALWTYYHTQPNCNVNASFYDIREYFQGRDEKGRMNSTSDDGIYNKLLGELKLEMKFLALQIEPKVYEYGFLIK